MNKTRLKTHSQRPSNSSGAIRLTPIDALLIVPYRIKRLFFQRLHSVLHKDIEYMNMPCIRKCNPSKYLDELKLTKHFTISSPLNTAVLFLIFNRLDSTAQVFEAIRQAKPLRLYVAGDGPREGWDDESERVEKVREIITMVDWPCEVKTLFREKNLGCKYAVTSAINWFFEQEEQGIILEDDCLPHYNFFEYCQWGLNQFKEDKRVWHINGNNFAADKKLYNQNVDFVSLPQVWGWATWADRWKNYEVNPFYIKASLLHGNQKEWNLTRVASINKMKHVFSLMTGLDAWDYQWQITVLNNAGLVLSSRSNLISNLGDGAYATHTKKDDRIRLPMEELLLPLESHEIVFNSELNKWFEKKMGLSSWRNAIFFSIIQAINPEFVFNAEINKWFKNKRGLSSWRNAILFSAVQAFNRLKLLADKIICRLLFSYQKPIVIAGTGRCGTTMLTESISESYVKAKFSGYPVFIRRLMMQFSTGYLSRIDQIQNSSSPVLKTHDVYRKSYSSLAKYIFVFGDPLEAALSVNETGKKYGNTWIEKHIFNLAGFGFPHELFQKDVLNYKNQLLSWSNTDDVLIVHFDDLWDRSDEIGKFIGFNLILPQRKPRNRVNKINPSNLDTDLFNELTSISYSLRNRHDRTADKRLAIRSG